MNKKQTIFLTGATGLLGSYLLKLFLENDHKVYVLARGKNGKSAKERVYDSVRFWDESLLHNISPSNNHTKSYGLLKDIPISNFQSSNYNKTKESLLNIIEGDITYPNLGINSRKIIEELISEPEIIYHCAASTNMSLYYDVLKKINVDGTKNILDFAIQCKKKGKLKKVNHISSISIAGRIGNINFTEDMFDLGQKFNNFYEQTKYQAEVLAREYQEKGLIISIFRFSMILGDSKEGRSTDFRLFFPLIRLFSREIFNEFPMEPSCEQNMINVDIAANMAYKLGEFQTGEIFHIINNKSCRLLSVFKIAANFYGFNLPNFIPANIFPFDTWTPVQKKIAEPFIPYLNYKTNFLCQKTQRSMEDKNIFFLKNYQIDFDKLFSYCEKKGFIKRQRKH